MKTKFILTFCILAGFLSAYGADYLIPRLSRAPQIDGHIQRSEWDGAASITLRTGDGLKLTNSTLLLLGYGDEHLYLALTCGEDNIAGMVTTHRNLEEHDNQIWNDDSIDLNIAPFGDHRLYKIIVNSSAITYDALNGDINWESNSEQVVKFTDTAWNLEMKIPFEQFGFTPKGGETWQINVGRNRVAAKELSSLTGEKGAFSAHLQSFQFAGEKGFSLIAVNHQNQQTLRGVFTRPGNYEVRIEGVAGDNRQLRCEKTVTVAEAGQEEMFSWKGASAPALLEVRVAGLYENSFALPPVRSYDLRAWVSEQPLYRELIASQLKPLPSLRWFHELQYYYVVSQALQYGFGFDPAKVYGDIAAGNNLIYTGYHQLTYDKLIQYRQEHSLRLLVSPDHRRVEMPATANKAKFLGDPRAEARFLEQVEDLCVRREEYNLAAIIYGDERSEYAIATLVALYQEKVDYPLVDEINEKIKREYGGGKWGIPESITDQTPGRWIATHQFISRQQAGLLGKAYEIIKRKAPDLPLITDDPVDGATTQDMAMWRGKFDIATGQLYPRRNPDLADFAYNTKKIKDLSGAKLMQPCAHIEHYAGNFSLPEVRALMGQAVIGGANGWHFYLADTIGRRSGKGHLITEYFGAPERYELIYNIAAATPRLKYPEPDCAFFVSQDSSWRSYRYRPDAEMAVFTMLGARAGLWFEMFNETVMPSLEMSKFKAVFVSDAKYERPEAIARLETYVRNGGTLVVFDPVAFQRNHLDEDISAQTEQFLGAKISRTKSDLVFVYQGKSYALPITCNSLELLGGAEAVASYGNGLPAVSRRKLGKGSIYQFAFNPATGRFLKARAWQEFARDFALSLQLQVDQPVWRFAFPEEMEPEPRKPVGNCLTGNAIQWSFFKPDGSANLPANGSYSWSRAPELIADHGVQDIPFSTGKLTNRRQAPTAGNVDKKLGKIQDWVVRFNPQEAITVTFDLAETKTVGRLHMYYQGQEPKLEIEYAENTQQWQKLTNATKNDPAGLVPELIINWPKTVKARYLKVTFMPTEDADDKSFTLAEMDIWDQPK